MRKLLERHPIIGDTNTHKDSVYFICHSIMQQMEFLKGKDMTHKEKKLPYFVPLSAVYLKTCLGSRIYKSTLDWMIKAGIIESDYSWEAKKVSKGYRFTEHYLGAGHRWVTITSYIAEKVSSVKDNRKNPFCPQVIGRLQKWFNPAVLTIDAKAARKEVKNTLKNEILDATRCKNIHRRLEMIFKARVKARKNENAINNFETGNYSFTQDEFGFRFHSPLTRLNKKLRQYIRCNGKELIQLDISGSQLYFGNYLFNPSAYLNSRNNLISINNQYKYQLWKNLYNNYNTIMFPRELEKNSKTLDSKGLQRNLYFEKTIEGSFYEGIVRELDAQEFFSNKLTHKQKRGKVKKSLLALLFGDIQNPMHRGLYNQNNIQILYAFEKMYPDAALLFNKIKYYHTKALCQLLQRIESICMLGLVCKRIQSVYPKIPIYTIHDCIATLPEFIPIVRRVMEEEFTRFIGESPKIDETSWLKLAA